MFDSIDFLPAVHLYHEIHREGELRKARPPKSTGSVMLDMMNKMGKMNLSAGVPPIKA